MTEREQDLPLAELTRQANEVMALHPGISVERQPNGSLMVLVGPEDVTQQPTRTIHAHALWSTEEQRVPDFVLDVRDSETGMLTTTLVARFEEGGFKNIENVHATEIDAFEVIRAVKQGVELFEAYGKLPHSARSLVPGLKVGDQVRTVEDLKEVYERAGAGMVVGWLVEDGVQYLSVEQYLSFIKYALKDLDPEDPDTHEI